ncbi:MAG: SDR family oxidoreductase [Betaproteobacteria bacterium]|nr:SDR family oxidoreductase [Betaproteobacteria bacterium]
MASLTGKCAVVTGASSEKGIGRAIAKRFAENGASVLLVAEGTESQLQEAQRECRESSAAGRIEYRIFDLSAAGAAEAMIVEAERLFGRVDILVNNAVFRTDFDFGDYTHDMFSKAVAVNIGAPFFASQAVVPLMRRQGGGRIIHIASQLAKVAFAKRALYGLTKAAIVHLTKSMAYELGRYGISVNSISPGPTLTQPILKRLNADPAQAKQRLDSYVPIGRFGEPDEIADVALFLATTSATYLHGEDICVDGGYTSH